MPISNRRRSGGPRSPAGKSRARVNAYKSGVAAIGWYDAQEEAEYNELVTELLHDYPDADVMMRLLIEQLAKNCVKLRRLERCDNALHEQARLLAGDFAAQRPANSAAALLPDTPQGRELAVSIMGDAALPDTERLDRIERYRLNLERQIGRQIAQIRQLAKDQASAGVPDKRQAPADISDVTILRAGDPPAAAPALDDQIHDSHDAAGKTP